MLCQDDTIRIVNTARVWSSAQRRQGTTPREGRIFASFKTENGSRRASVWRHGVNGQVLVLGTLKYNPALKWCSEHLKREE